MGKIAGASLLTVTLPSRLSVAVTWERKLAIAVLSAEVPALLSAATVMEFGALIIGAVVSGAGGESEPPPPPQPARAKSNREIEILFFKWVPLVF